jgi:hypothetical protein
MNLPEQQKRPRGRPPIDVDQDKILELASIACTLDEIAMLCGCSVSTLRGKYKEVYDLGFAKARSSLRREQWKAAHSGSNAMLIWLGKQMLGQRDFKDDPAKAQDAELTAAELDQKISKLLEAPQVSLNTDTPSGENE